MGQEAAVMLHLSRCSFVALMILQCNDRARHNDLVARCVLGELLGDVLVADLIGVGAL